VGEVAGVIQYEVHFLDYFFMSVHNTDGAVNPKLHCLECVFLSKCALHFDSLPAFLQRKEMGPLPTE